MTSEIIILCVAAFAAGFIDSIVGGGGLVQTPATLVVLPQYPVATLLGTTKIPAFIGTSMAAYQYAKRVALQWRVNNNFSSQMLRFRCALCNESPSEPQPT